MITILTSYNFEIRSNCPNSLGLEYLPQVQYSLLPAVIPYGTIYKRNKYIVEHATRQVDNINSAREEVKNYLRKEWTVLRLFILTKPYGSNP